MYEEAIHRMSKVMTSLNVKIATKPRTSDPSVSADDTESQYTENEASDCEGEIAIAPAPSGIIAYDAPTLPTCGWP